MKFRIYRYDPEKDAKPYYKDYDVELDPHDRMLLDALVRLKSIDDSLSFRRSCREGVCGSDAMNINGKNGLACITNLKTLKEPVELRHYSQLVPAALADELARAGDLGLPECGELLAVVGVGGEEGGVERPD